MSRMNLYVQTMGEIVMNMRDEADKVFNLDVSKDEKIKGLVDLELDCINELDAQDQNMQPEIKNRVSEGLRKIRDYLRVLRS
jgi:phosphate uptake regulator